MKSIKVVEFLGTPCLLAAEKGVALAKEIKESLGFLSSTVEVDFTGAEFLSSAFLNHAFGQICIDEDWDTHKFQKKVKVIGLDEDDADELTLAIDNAQIRRSLVKKGISAEEYYSSRVPA